jgi:hypothetical protein
LSEIEKLLSGVALPPVAPVSQAFDATALSDPEAHLRALLEAGDFRFKPGARIAITCGSRGIDQYGALVTTTGSFLRARGAQPVLVPSMGSPGGATAQGQRLVLEQYGGTEEAMNAPILSSMETVEIGRTAQNLPVLVDNYAAEADGIVLLNRVKPHTSFRGRYESGLMKMLAIGLAKQKGAETTHSLRFEHMAENIEAMGAVALQKLNILFAVATVENGYNRIAELHVLRRNEIMDREPELLNRAWDRMPRIYLDEIDVLLVGRAGKDISGTGMDTNIIGRFHTNAASGGPLTVKLGLLDLSDKSEGNANGMGLADFIPRRFYDKIDFTTTYINTLTSTEPNSSRLPMVLDNDLQVAQACVKLCGRLRTEEIRLAAIPSTKELDRIYLSPAALDAVCRPEKTTRQGDFIPLPFDKAGNLLLFSGKK